MFVPRWKEWFRDGVKNVLGPRHFDPYVDLKETYLILENSFESHSLSYESRFLVFGVEYSFINRMHNLWGTHPVRGPDRDAIDS